LRGVNFCDFFFPEFFFSSIKLFFTAKKWSGISDWDGEVNWKWSRISQRGGEVKRSGTRTICVTNQNRARLWFENRLVMFNKH
jgi:hypothetical protein